MTGQLGGITFEAPYGIRLNRNSAAYRLNRYPRQDPTLWQGVQASLSAGL